MGTTNRRPVVGLLDRTPEEVDDADAFVDFRVTSRHPAFDLADSLGFTLESYGDNGYDIVYANGVCILDSVDTLTEAEDVLLIYKIGRDDALRDTE